MSVFTPESSTAIFTPDDSTAAQPVIEREIDCEMCGKVTRVDGQPLSVCAGCKCNFYCSSICQSAHWKKVHRGQCKLMSKDVDPRSRVPAIVRKHQRDLAVYYRAIVPQLGQWLWPMLDLLDNPKNSSKLMFYLNVRWIGTLKCKCPGRSYEPVIGNVVPLELLDALNTAPDLPNATQCHQNAVKTSAPAMSKDDLMVTIYFNEHKDPLETGSLWNLILDKKSKEMWAGEPQKRSLYESRRDSWNLTMPTIMEAQLVSECKCTGA